MNRDGLAKAADLALNAQRLAGVQSGQPALSGQREPLADTTGLLARALAILDEDKTSAAAPFARAASLSGELAIRRAGLGPAPETQLTLQRRVLSDGAECFLPIRYFDVQCLVATFLAPPDQASGLLAGVGLQPVLQEDGRAMVDLYCIEYRKTDIGPYNEVGLTIRATAPGDPIPASYVLNLPVNTAIACRAGREIWGYNKFVAAIDVESEGKAFSTVLRDAGREIIGALEGTRGASVPAPPTDILTFTSQHGRLVKTLISVPTPSFASSGGSFLFKVGTSDHPMAGNLRTLALDGARPVLVHYANPFQALLFPGRAI
ncbi:MAG TPA: acetoacetate decarboxylase family protein [Roseiarcus sp.]|nr:acetoacetate decarboxylase family protein [Roseiarcus sp.]